MPNKHTKTRMDYKNLVIEIKDNIALISINRPEALNALNTQFFNEMDHFIKEVSQNPEVKIIIITGMGKAFVFNYQGGPTYRCAFPEQPEQNDIPNCSTIGVLGSLTGIIGSLQANEALKIILGHQEVLSGKIMQLNTLNYDFHLIDLEKDHTTSRITELGNYLDDSCTKKEVKNISSDELSQILNSKKEVLIYNLNYSSSQKNLIEGSKNVDTEELLLGSIPLPEDRMIVLVCEYGIQSENIAEYIQNAYNKENIYSLKDGMLGWKSKHL